MIRALAAILLLAGTAQAQDLALPTAAGHWPAAGEPAASDQLPSVQGLDGPETATKGFPAEPDNSAWVRYFSQGEGRAWLTEGLERSRPYRDFILARLSERGLPEELFYVAMIESTFSVRARSNSGALGLWQFMLNSIGDWMRANEWVDERLDFWASTYGAIAKLEDNYRALGDWGLALAAYNAGLGRISRLTAKSGARNFAELALQPDLPTETRTYVPKILAAAQAGKHLARNRLPIAWGKPVAWCKVGVSRPVSISWLEQHAAIPPPILRAANAELRHDLTPPSKIYYLKVPLRYREALIAALSQDNMQFDHVVHVVKAGDTLYSLSRAYGSSVAQMLEWNPGLDAETLRPGQKLIIPLVRKAAAAETSKKGADS